MALLGSFPSINASFKQCHSLNVDVVSHRVRYKSNMYNNYNNI